MDLQMPIMGGFEATQIIRQQLKLATPIIALTANAFKNEIEKCMEIGMNDYVTKPFEEVQLLKVLQKYTGEIGLNDKIKNFDKDDTPHIEQSLYNLTLLKQLSRGDAEFINEMVRLFCESIPEALQILVDSSERNDYKTLKFTAHKIKPAIQNLGVTLVAQDILFLEKLEVQNMNHHKVLETVNKVKEILTTVVQELSSIKREH
jgi:YesN/AraC family two-component response regulator